MSETTQVYDPVDVPVTDDIPLAESEAEPVALSISLEGVVYVALAATVLLMYVLRLGIVPLTVTEIPRALAAWQAAQPGIEATTSGDSALLQLAHMLSLTIFGNSEEAVRAPTAILGFLLVFSPLLFRDVLGRTRAFLIVIGLAFSPMMLAASRLDSPVVWQMFFALLALWVLKRHVLEQNATLSTVAIVLFGAAALLTGTTGLLTVVMMVAALILADSFLRRRDETYAEDTIPVVARLREWAWIPGIGLSALIVLTTATAFMLYPPGLDALAQSIGSGLAGWFVPQEGAPFAFGLAASLFYEPLYWAFGIIGIILIFDRDEITFVDGFFVAWLAVAGIVALLYQGATAANALWLTIPLAGLMSKVILSALESETGMLWYAEDDAMNNVLGFSIPSWARWVIMGTSALLFSLVLMHVGWLSRSLVTADFSAGSFLDRLNAIAAPLFFLTVMLLLFVLAGFSFASLYGGRETLRGGALGIVIVGLFASLGGGWQVAVSRADDPRELWHTRAVGEEAFILRDQLLTLARRETEGLAGAASAGTILSMGVLGWLRVVFQRQHPIGGSHAQAHRSD
ncbi:MAG: glycosyltransferase family 39 protein, partial [Chloroflexota bacterium]